MTQLQLALVHENEASLLRASGVFAQNGFDVFACHDIDAAHAAIDHENILALILAKNPNPSLALINQRVIRHLKVYHPGISINLVDFQNHAELANLANKQSYKHATQSIETRPGQVFHMKHLEYFIEKAAITTVFQPIVRLSNSPTWPQLGVEALSRICWPGAVGTVNPELIFSYAANSNKLFELDLACMRSAFKSAVNYPISSKIFINVRPLTLIHPNFFQKIQDLKAGLPAHQIVFEITEHETLPDMEILVSALANLKALGFDLAIDDFGKGYANLNLLHALTPSYIKISGLFADKLVLSARKKAIVKAVANLAGDLGLDVILENVDNQECAQEALRLGISYAQGYYFGRPGE